MSYSNRIWLYGPVGLLLLLFLLYSIFWRAQADMLAARLDSANGGEIVPGVVFAFADKTVTGFPLRLDVLLSGVSFSHASADGSTAWRAEKLALHALTYGRELYILEAAGLQSFEEPGDSGGPIRVMTMTPGLMRASAIMRDRRLMRFDLDIVQPEGKDATLGAEPTRTFSAGRAQIHFLSHPDDAIDVAMRIDQATIGEGFHAALGGMIGFVDLRGKILKSGNLAALVSGGQNPAEAAENWRKAGGQLTVDKLALEWAGVKTELAGAIGLDDKHRPDGVLVGTFDPSQVLGALIGGLRLQSGTSTFSLTFKDGDIKLGADLSLSGRAR
jgi:hypothetical protein